MTVPIFILAGENSGDVLSSRLMQAINASYGQQDWVGLGGLHMAKQGLVSYGDMERLSFIGLGKALWHYRDLMRFVDELVDLVIEKRPKLVLTVDAKGFSVRFAERLKKRMKNVGWSVPIIHTVAPTIWAWGLWRRHKFARVMDGLLCLFPFEPDYFTPLGLKSSFIGHPAAFNRMISIPKKQNKTFSSTYVVVLLPGSRIAEINYILPAMTAATNLLRQRFDRIKFILPAVPRLRDRIATLCDGYEIVIISREQSLEDALRNCDAVIAASGTVTLESALHGAPGVACYKTGWLSASVFRLIVDMQKVILPNVILNREVYPFLFQEYVTPENLASKIATILHDPTAKAKSYQIAQDLRACLVGKSEKFDTLVIEALKQWLGPTLTHNA